MTASFWAALSFLTLLPSPRGARVPPVERIGDSLVWYPFVGAILGAILAAAAAVLFRSLPPLPAGVLLTLLWALATGGLHLDGVADACDALFSSRTRERALEIMKDPHVGAMGAIGLFGVLAAKATLLASFGPSLGARSLPIVAACVLGRWAMALACATSRYARPEGGIASGIIQPHARRAVLVTLWILPSVACLRVLLAALGVAAVVLLARAVFVRRLGGLTGDCAGAIGEISEVVALTMFLAGVPSH